jgi:segregation and condensation protein B
MDPDIKKQVEAIVFSCGRKIEPEEIAGLVGIAPSVVRTALKDLLQDYNGRDSSLMLIEEGTAYKMAVREKYLAVVRKISPYMEFSKSVMETLAVVAWKQPILQSDVIRIRTNKAYDHIAELEQLGFLAKEKHGRSFLLKLSQKFYDYFDLRNDVDVRTLFKHIKDETPGQQKLTDVVPETASEKKEQKTEDAPEG